MNKSVLDDEITLLFNNRKLNRFYIMVTMYELKLKYGSRKVLLETLSDYITIINCQNDNKKINLELFSRIEQQVAESIIYLANLKLISIEGDVSDSLGKIKIILTEIGKKEAKLIVKRGIDGISK